MVEGAQASESDEPDDSFFRMLVESMPQMVWTKDACGRNDYGNPSFLDFLNITFDEFIHHSWSVVHPDDAARGQAAWQAAHEGARPYEAELRMRPRGASAYRWFLVRAVPYRNAAGRIERWFGSTTDIDAQRRAFAALDFLAQSSVQLAGAQQVHSVLERLAHASLEGLADISLFDLEEDGRFIRLVHTASTVSAANRERVMSFEAPRLDDAHPISRAMRDGTTVHFPEVDADIINGSVADAARREAWRALDIKSLVSAPMIVPGRVLGALTLVRSGTRAPFGTADMSVIEEVARRAAAAIDAIRSKDRDERNARDLQVFADLGESISEAVGLTDTLGAAMRTIVPRRADWAFITLADEAGDLRLAAVSHPHDVMRRAVAEQIGALYAGPGGESVTTEVIRTRAPVFRPTTDHAIARRAVNPPLLDALWTAGCASLIVVPLFSGDVVRGTVHLFMSTAERTFAATDVDFFAEFARRLAPVIANAEVFERERRVARSFQDAALPAALPEVAGLAFDAIYEAGRSESLVGGDWYDAFELRDGRIVVSIGDVAGSGLLAAVTMASVRQAIRGAAHVLADPVIMLAAADRALSDPEERFVTAFVGVIDRATSTLVYQSAGHPPPLLALRDGSIIELQGGGPPLGLHAESGVSSHVERLPHGSLLVLYTDGLIESTHDILAGEARLRATLGDAAIRESAHPAADVHDAMLIEGSRDDVAILTLFTS
jgi:PAS domain S-box-containing protein